MARGSIALGPRFEAWKDTHDQTDEQLARYLGVTVDVLAQLAAESVAATDTPAGFKGIGEDWNSGAWDQPDGHQLEQLAQRHGADPKRLTDVAWNEMREDR